MQISISFMSYLFSRIETLTTQASSKSERAITEPPSNPDFPQNLTSLEGPTKSKVTPVAHVRRPLIVTSKSER